MITFRHLPILLQLSSLSLLLIGCNSNTRPPVSLERAVALSMRGDHTAAAREYEALALATRAPNNPALLAAAKEWLRASDTAAAESVLARLIGPLQADQTDLLNLMLAEAHLLRGEAARGWELLGQMDVPVGAARVDEYNALRQRLALATSRPVQAIRSQVDRETSAADAATTLRTRQEFLRELMAAVDRGILLDPRVAGRDAMARGWLEAAPLAARAARAPQESNARITAAWRKRYPSHPAAEVLAMLGESTATTVSSETTARAAPKTLLPDGESGSTAFLPLEQAIARAAHVAVLLPLSGHSGASGSKIREGLLSGYFSEPQAIRMPLRFYDTARQSVADALVAATQGGAVSIIGPLTCEEVIAAAASVGSSSVLSVIALNSLPSSQSAPANFRQFALSPEDEARAVARHALAEGLRRAIALVPSGDWGARVLQAFHEELKAGGGELLGSDTLAGRELGMTARSLLRLDSSITRHRRLEAMLNVPLAFRPRRRADIDFIFMPGTASSLRQWRPQLRFQGAGDIPAYATSDAFDGGGGDELQGLIFPDIDWMIAPQAPAVVALRAAVNDPTNRSRLFALGHDAWLLNTALRIGRSPSPAAPLTGVVGTLSIDEQGRVKRSLRFAQINDGQPKLIDPSGGGGRGRPLAIPRPRL
ncbi:MAG: hypothetical protein FJ196_00260 [Gammaproteobacteria bacterium]|nr:hypothetical protein [Gammaproteobacteria bacterium]